MNITLSGADERTKIGDLIRLSDMGAEIALLYTFSPDGRHRYPDPFWLMEAALALNGSAALHICGSRARQAMVDGKLDFLLARVGRIQVNGQFDVGELNYFCEAELDHQIITQHTERNSFLVNVFKANHSILVDASGGRGISPSLWERPVTNKSVGFAGGLGPHNLAEQLPKIAAVAIEPSWIDLESGLRDTDDWFDIDKAMEVMRIFRMWNKDDFWSKVKVIDV